MGLYDIIDDISERNITKTEMGDTRVFGVMVGLVARNYHPDMGGRVCVTIPTRDAGANELKWARLAMPSSGDSWGHYFLPEVGDQVLLAFENGNIERPYVIGCVPKDNNKFLNAAVDAGNQYKRIVTRHGNAIEFEDSTLSPDGQMDKITIKTAGESHSIRMDNGASNITIGNKDKTNSISIDTMAANGVIEITAANSLVIKVGQTIKVTLNGDSGSVKIEAQQLSVQASSGIKLVTDAMMQLEGLQITEKASAMHKIESSGPVSISGAPIKIG